MLKTGKSESKNENKVGPLSTVQRQANFDSQSEGDDVTLSDDDCDYMGYNEDEVDYERDEGDNHEHGEGEGEGRGEGGGEVDYERDEGEVEGEEPAAANYSAATEIRGAGNPLKRPRASTESNTPAAKKDKSDLGTLSPPFLPSLDALEDNRPKIGKGPWVDRLLLP